MQRVPIARAARATLVVALLSTGCTSAPAEPGGAPGSPPSTGASVPSPAPTAVSPTAPSQATGLDHAAARVSIRPPLDGSFHVRGTYPWNPSSCVRPERPTLDRRYPGALTIRTADDATLTVTVTLTFRQYLEGIAEVPPTWPRAALEAQVIAARSYVLSRTGWAGEQGEDLEAPICGTSDCQVYGGIPHPRPRGLGRWYAAVRATRGLVLLSGGRPADTVYFSTSNGRTYGNEDVFGSSPLPYLRPVVERDDGASPLSRWHVDVPLRDVETVLQAASSWPRGAPIASAAVEGSSLRLSGGGASRTILSNDLRDAVNTWGPCLLPRRYPTDGLPVTIPSGWFGVSSSPRSVTFDGRGWGHGVGMVQWGAYGKARRGWSASRILAFYYGGLTPQRYPEPRTMRVVVATGLRSLTVKPSEPGSAIGGERLGPRKLHLTGGDQVTVTSG